MDPDAWYRLTLLRRQESTILLLADGRNSVAPVPTIVWRARDRQTTRPGSGIRLEQHGAGSWRSLRVWEHGYVGHLPPPPPSDVTAEAIGRGRVLLRWSGGHACDVHRDSEPGFVATERNRIARQVRGPGYDDFTVAVADDYALWGLVTAPHGSADSFYVALDHHPGGTLRGWMTGTYTTWGWSRILGQVSLAAGDHTVTLRHREAGARVGAILVTSALDWRPGEP